jgi:uncharacterized membrane protein
MPRSLAALLAWLAFAIDWLARPERRRWLYRVVVAVLPLLIAVNVVSADTAPAWLTLVQALLGVTAGGLAWTLSEAAWRSWLYGIATAVSGLLVVLDVLPETTAPLILTVCQAVLGVTAGVVADRHVPDGSYDPSILDSDDPADYRGGGH